MSNLYENTELKNKTNAKINNIKQNKVLEAKRIFETKRISSLAIHFDIFNSQVAFIKLNKIKDDSLNWITRQQIEGQTIFNIDQNYFSWKLTKTLPLIDNIFAEII